MFWSPKNKTIRWNLWVSLLVNILMWGFLYWKIEARVDPVVLKYNIYFGISLIGDWWRVFWFPLLAFIILLINFLVAAAIVKKQKYLAYFLVYTATVVQILLGVVSFFTVLLNV